MFALVIKKYQFTEWNESLVYVCFVLILFTATLDIWQKFSLLIELHTTLMARFRKAYDCTSVCALENEEALAVLLLLFNLKQFEKCKLVLLVS